MPPRQPHSPMPRTNSPSGDRSRASASPRCAAPAGGEARKCLGRPAQRQPMQGRMPACLGEQAAPPVRAHMQAERTGGHSSRGAGASLCPPSAPRRGCGRPMGRTACEIRLSMRRKLNCAPSTGGGTRRRGCERPRQPAVSTCTDNGASLPPGDHELPLCIWLPLPAAAAPQHTCPSLYRRATSVPRSSGVVLVSRRRAIQGYAEPSTWGGEGGPGRLIGRQAIYAVLSPGMCGARRRRCTAPQNSVAPACLAVLHTRAHLVVGVGGQRDSLREVGQGSRWVRARR